jgi:hypothetical protein
MGEFITARDQQSESSHFLSFEVIVEDIGPSGREVPAGVASWVIARLKLREAAAEADRCYLSHGSPNPIKNHVNNVAQKTPCFGCTLIVQQFGRLQKSNRGRD